MATVSSADPGVTGQEFVVTRAFDAPRDLVFKAWTEEERLARWWGPKGFTMLSCTLDARPGGRFHFGMRMPNGDEMWARWTFREIVAPERLVFVSSFSDPQGGIAGAPFFEVWPREILSTVTFAEQDGRTAVTVRSAPINASDAELQAFLGMFKSMRGGWGGTLDQLADYLASA